MYKYCVDIRHLLVVDLLVAASALLEAAQLAGHLGRGRPRPRHPGTRRADHGEADNSGEVTLARLRCGGW